MKKIGFLIALFIGIAIKNFAQFQQNVVQIKLRNEKLLTVVMDGRHYKRFGRTITFTDVPVGMHEIKVYRYYPNDDNRYFDSRPRAVLTYKGKIRVDHSVNYFCTVDPQYRTMSIRESKVDFDDDNEKTYRINQQIDFDENRGNQGDENINDDNSLGDDRSKPIDNDANFLTKEQLGSLKNAVENRIGSSDKVNLIQNFLEHKKMTTDQVETILGWLSFENYKLQIASFCYPRVIDQDKYLQISNLFTFQSSKQALDKLMFDNKENAKNNSNLQQTNLISESQISILSKEVKIKITDTEKQKIMFQNLAEYKMTTSQIASMMDWFTFEGSKLEFAKWAYSRVNDKSNYLQIKNKLTFLSSKNAIDELMKRK
jgi:hypothetical protein